jgi:hypothetical protein
MPSLDELELDCDTGGQGTVDAVAAARLPALRSLDLGSGSPGLDLRPLAASARYALHELGTHGESVNDDFFAALAVAPFARSLRSFSFGGSVTARGARALAASRDLQPGLAIVRRAWPSAADPVLAALVKRFPLLDQIV